MCTGIQILHKFKLFVHLTSKNKLTVQSAPDTASSKNPPHLSDAFQTEGSHHQVRRDTYSRTDPSKAVAWASESLSWGLWDISSPSSGAQRPGWIPHSPLRAGRPCATPARAGGASGTLGRAGWPPGRGGALRIPVAPGRRRAGGGRRGAVAGRRRWGATAAISWERPGPAAAVREKRRRVPPGRNSDWEARAAREAGGLSSR